MKELSDIDIRHFKLSSGEDIITLVTKEETDVVVVTQPMAMHSSIDQQSQAYYFTDWQPMAKVNSCAISKLHIISFVECSDNVKEKYIRMCLETNSDTDMGDFLDIDPDDEMDIELDEYLDPLPDNSNPTIH
jgi:hypothetical protein